MAKKPSRITKKKNTTNTHDDIGIPKGGYVQIDAMTFRKNRKKCLSNVFSTSKTRYLVYERDKPHYAIVPVDDLCDLCGLRLVDGKPRPADDGDDPKAPPPRKRPTHLT